MAGRYAYSSLVNTPVCQSSDTLMCSKQYLCSCHRTFQWCANCLLYQAVNSLFVASQLDIWSWEEGQAPWFQSWIHHIYLFSEYTVCYCWTVSFSSCKWAGGFPIEQNQPGITGGWIILCMKEAEKLGSPFQMKKLSHILLLFSLVYFFLRADD